MNQPRKIDPPQTVEHVTTLCGGGHGPTVYRTDRGTLLVQGTAVYCAAVATPAPHQRLVEIPTGLLAPLIRQQPPDQPPTEAHPTSTSKDHR